MVRAMEQEQQERQEQENYKSRLLHFKGMYENAGGRNTKSMVIETTNFLDQDHNHPGTSSVVTVDGNNRTASRSYSSSGSRLLPQKITNSQVPKSPLDRAKPPAGKKIYLFSFDNFYFEMMQS